MELKRALAHEPNHPTQSHINALIVFNFFSLEGYHVADAFDIPCVCASPHLVPYKAPSFMISQIEKLMLEIGACEVSMSEVCCFLAWFPNKK